MEEEIRKLIKKHYKTAVLEEIAVEKSAVFQDDTSVILKCHNRSQDTPHIALRILNKYPEVRLVHFTGGWLEAVYTRETLKWAGYKVK